MRSLEQLTRDNIRKLTPYSCARNEFSGRNASVFLDANENPFDNGVNRYPDPLQLELKSRIAPVKGVRPSQICLGNGSDETIDLMFRCFTEPRIDNVVAIEPTYGMYRVCADINDIEYRTVELDEKFQVCADKLLAATDANTKIIWICSPNNPTGNSIEREEIVRTIEQFDGLVVVDEAYSDFSSQRPLRLDIDKYPNLVVLNTFSKAYGAAAIRLGMAFASEQIIAIFNKVKYPYNISKLTQEHALGLVKNQTQIRKNVMMILDERSALMKAFSLLPSCQKVYPTDANFFLARMTNASMVYDYLVGEGIIVRNRTNVTLCNNCLRVTVGTKTENTQLLAALRRYK